MLFRPRLSHRSLPLQPVIPRASQHQRWHSSNSQSRCLPQYAPPSRSHRPHDPPHFFNATRFFSTTTPHRAGTHYDTLGVTPSVSQKDLKRRFYDLSKEHHPDLHPNSTSAVQRFQEISESYSVLADPEKRRRYDRDVLPRQQQRQAQETHTQRGGTYAGSRAPTGLSKRSSAFRGPPPSYFKHGEGGNYTGQSQQQQQSSSSATGESEKYYSHDGTEFDARPVYRTQTAEDTRRNARRAAAMAAAQAAAEEEGDFWARFVMVSLVLLGGITFGSLMVGYASGSKSGGGAGGMVRGDGTRRDAGGSGKREEKSGA